MIENNICCIMHTAATLKDKPLCKDCFWNLPLYTNVQEVVFLNDEINHELNPKSIAALNAIYFQHQQQQAQMITSTSTGFNQLQSYCAGWLGGILGK